MYEDNLLLGTDGSTKDTPEFEGERYDSKPAKRIVMVFDKKYISDDNHILGVTNIGPQDILFIEKSKDKNLTVLEGKSLLILLGNMKNEILASFKDEAERNAFFDKIESELT